MNINLMSTKSYSGKEMDLICDFELDFELVLTFIILEVYSIGQVGTRK